MKPLYKRLIYFTLFLILTAVEVLIALYVHDCFVRPYLGDVLAVIVVYCLIRTILPQKVRLLPLYIFLFALCVELLQLIQLTDILNIRNQVLLTLLGSVFDWKDILCYGIGCLLPGAWEYIQKRKMN